MAFMKLIFSKFTSMLTNQKEKICFDGAKIGMKIFYAHEDQHQI